KQAHEQTLGAHENALVWQLEVRLDANSVARAIVHRTGGPLKPVFGLSGDVPTSQTYSGELHPLPRPCGPLAVTSLISSTDYLLSSSSHSKPHASHLQIFAWTSTGSVSHDPEGINGLSSSRHVTFAE